MTSVCSLTIPPTRRKPLGAWSSQKPRQMCRALHRSSLSISARSVFGVARTRLSRVPMVLRTVSLLTLVSGAAVSLIILRLTHTVPGYMNTTTYNGVTNIASTDPGSTWGRVYTTLRDNWNVTTIGGRASVVGVGGFVTGGGVSTFVHDAAPSRY